MNPVCAWRSASISSSAVPPSLCVDSSPVARNLDVLDLSHNQITDPNAVDLARRRANFPKLSSLDVTGNCLTAKGLEALAEVAVTIRSLRQEP
jgi:Leucine-rich repeat (LRR) protein